MLFLSILRSIDAPFMSDYRVKPQSFQIACQAAGSGLICSAGMIDTDLFGGDT
jgi:hypothetical protein